MRIVSWNIQHGGGRRVGRLLDQVGIWRPDVLGLVEFRPNAAGAAIADALAKMGLSHQFSTVDRNQPRVNRVMLASRYPMTLVETDGLLAESGRWLRVCIHAEVDLDLALMHVPNRDKTGVKYAFHDAVVKELAPLASRPSVALGDTNTGVPKLDETTPFFNAREGQWFANLEAAGWIDCFRHNCRDGLVETWRNHNGSRFRIDQAFVTESSLPRVSSMAYDWGEKDPESERFASDHAAIVLDLDWREPAIALPP